MERDLAVTAVIALRNNGSPESVALAAWISAVMRLDDPNLQAPEAPAETFADDAEGVQAQSGPAGASADPNAT